MKDSKQKKDKNSKEQANNNNNNNNLNIKKNTLTNSNSAINIKNLQSVNHLSSANLIVEKKQKGYQFEFFYDLIKNLKIEKRLQNSLLINNNKFSPKLNFNSTSNISSNNTISNGNIIANVNSSNNNNLLVNNNNIHHSHKFNQQLQLSIRRTLQKKYNVNVKKYNDFVTSDLIYNKNCHLVSVMKDFMILDYVDEFLKRTYKIYESKERVPKIANYYKNYLKFFCNPVFVEFKLNDIIQGYGDQKAEMYYNKNYGGKQSHNVKGNNSINNVDKRKNKNKNRNNNNCSVLKTIFNTTVKENIDRNSLTQSTIKNDLIDDNSVYYVGNHLLNVVNNNIINTNHYSNYKEESLKSHNYKIKSSLNNFDNRIKDAIDKIEVNENFEAKHGNSTYLNYSQNSINSGILLTKRSNEESLLNILSNFESDATKTSSKNYRTISTGVASSFLNVNNVNNTKRIIKVNSKIDISKNNNKENILVIKEFEKKLTLNNNNNNNNTNTPVNLNRIESNTNLNGNVINIKNENKTIESNTNLNIDSNYYKKIQHNRANTITKESLSISNNNKNNENNRIKSKSITQRLFNPNNEEEATITSQKSIKNLKISSSNNVNNSNNLTNQNNNSKSNKSEFQLNKQNCNLAITNNNLNNHLAESTKYNFKSNLNAVKASPIKSNNLTKEVINNYQNKLNSLIKTNSSLKFSNSRSNSTIGLNDLPNSNNSNNINSNSNNNHNTGHAKNVYSTEIIQSYTHFNKDYNKDCINSPSSPLMNNSKSKLKSSLNDIQKLLKEGNIATNNIISNKNRINLNSNLKIGSTSPISNVRNANILSNNYNNIISNNNSTNNNGRTITITNSNNEVNNNDVMKITLSLYMDKGSRNKVNGELIQSSTQPVANYFASEIIKKAAVNSNNVNQAVNHNNNNILEKSINNFNININNQINFPDMKKLNINNFLERKEKLSRNKTSSIYCTKSMKDETSGATNRHLSNSKRQNNMNININNVIKPVDNLYKIIHGQGDSKQIYSSYSSNLQGIL